MVSVNPYRYVDIYNDDYVEEYRGREVYERPPHIFAIADSAFHDMRRLQKDSCILISGREVMIYSTSYGGCGQCEVIFFYCRRKWVWKD